MARPVSPSCLIALIALALPGAASAYCLNKYPGQSSYAAWAAQPVKYRVSTTLTDTKLLAAIDKAFATWGSVQCSKLSFSKAAQFAMSAAPFNKSTGHINIYWVTKASELPSGMDSKYYFFHFLHYNPKGQLVGASMAVNAMTYKWSATGGDAATFDLQNVLTHYVGKVIGLAESKTKGTVMYPDVTFGQTTKQKLTADDTAGLQYLYLASGCPSPPAPAATGCSSGTVPPPPTSDSGATTADAGVLPTGDAGAGPTADGGVAPAGDTGLPPGQLDGAGGYYHDTGTGGTGGTGGQCNSSSDCAADEVCTAEGTCVKVGAGGSGGGGGCSYAGSAGTPLLPLLLLLGLPLGLVRRR